MKKIIVTAAAILACIIGFAEEVSINEAHTIARHFLGGTDDVKFTAGSTDGSENGGKAPAFYLFNGDSQWVIVAADDIATPVLMHGGGNIGIEDMPDNMRAYLESMACSIGEAKAQGVRQSAGIKAKWEALSTAPYQATPKETVLHTARWHQHSPFNNDCPVDTRFEGMPHCVTGCVATAMGIIMQYHRWPERGIGSTKAYTTESIKLNVPSRNLEHDYNWDSMPYSISDGSPAEVKEAVATLMADCGAMVWMDYTANSSGSSTVYAILSMVSHMSYSAHARELYRSGYSNAQWFEMLKAEIDNDCPVLYGGSDTKGQGAHQFICDGYNSDGEIRINWGWGWPENDDTWCAVSYLDVSPYVFSLVDSAVFGLVPDKNHDRPTEPSAPLMIYNGVELSSGQLKKGEFFTVEADLANVSPSFYDGKVCAMLVDIDGNKTPVSSTQDFSVDTPYYKGFDISNCRFTKDPAVGDRICIGYTDEKGEIRIAQAYGEGTQSYLGLLDVNFIDIPNEFHAGQIMYPSIIYGYNATVSNRVYSVKWYVDDVQGSGNGIVLKAGVHTVKAKLTFYDGSTETIVKKITVTN